MAVHSFFFGYADPGGAPRALKLEEGFFGRGSQVLDHFGGFNRQVYRIVCAIYACFPLQCKSSFKSD